MTFTVAIPKLAPKDRVIYREQFIKHLPVENQSWACLQAGVVVERIDPDGRMVWVKWDMYPEHPRSLAFARHLKKVA